MVASVGRVLVVHAVLGAAVAAAGDNNALAGALSAGGVEAAAPYISKWLYGKDKGSDLTAEEKETVTAITNLLGTAMGAAVGNSATDAAQGSLNTQSAVENNWLSAKQLIEVDKAYFACDTDEICKQRVVDEARILNQAQDTRLTWAKFKCTTFSSCDDLNTMDKQWVYSIGINNVVVELRKHYPNATHQQLMQVAQMYAAEADSSYNQGTTRFITGALNDSPAFGLAALGLKTTVKGGINTFLTGPMYGSKAAQLGAIGSESSFIKNIITSQKIAPDLMIKGVHFNIGQIELKALPNHEGGIIFKPVFSYSNPNEVAKAIAQANQALKDERFRTFLIKHAEAGIQMSKQTNNPKILEFQFLKDALQRSSNENIKHKNR